MLGMRISALRRQKNWSQKELAERMGVRPSTIGMYEQGRREPDCAGLLRLAELFGGSGMYFPELDKLLTELRNANIRAEFDGLSADGDGCGRKGRRRAACPLGADAGEAGWNAAAAR